MSPSGIRYILRWGQDETGALKLMDYCSVALARKTSWVSSAMMERLLDTREDVIRH